MPDLGPLCGSQIANGDLLDGYARFSEKPGHTLEIKNGSGGDAIIKARDALTGQLVVSFLVAKNATASFGRLPDGAYRFQYAFGPALKPDCKSFARITTAGQFPDIENMTTERTSTSTVTRHLTYTLYSVPSGNVRPQSLSATAFEAQ